MSGCLFRPGLAHFVTRRVQMQALHIDNVLAARDVDSFHDVPLPGPGEREGFTNQDAFMRAHEGTQIQIAKNLDETEKTDPFFADRDELEDRN